MTLRETKATQGLGKGSGPKMDLFFTFPQAYLPGKAAENSMLSLQPQEHEKAPLPVEKKDGCCFWEKECPTVAQAGDGESDVLRAGPGWPLGPP